MSYPATGVYALYRNPIQDVAQYPPLEMIGCVVGTCTSNTTPSTAYTTCTSRMYAWMVHRCVDMLYDPSVFNGHGTLDKRTLSGYSGALSVARPHTTALFHADPSSRVDVDMLQDGQCGCRPLQGRHGSVWSSILLLSPSFGDGGQGIRCNSIVSRATDCGWKRTCILLSVMWIVLAHTESTAVHWVLCKLSGRRLRTTKQVGTQTHPRPWNEFKKLQICHHSA
jgi:hypothetical protein